MTIKKTCVSLRNPLTFSWMLSGGKENVKGQKS